MLNLAALTFLYFAFDRNDGCLFWYQTSVMIIIIIIITTIIIIIKLWWLRYCWEEILQGSLTS
jgi:hypothetical protein